MLAELDSEAHTVNSLALEVSGDVELFNCNDAGEGGCISVGGRDGSVQ